MHGDMDEKYKYNEFLMSSARNVWIWTTFEISAYIFINPLGPEFSFKFEHTLYIKCEYYRNQKR